MNSFEETSFESHAGWFEKNYPDKQYRGEVLENNKNTASLNYWLHERLFSLADPLLKADEKWLTVGDAYALDGYYLRRKGCHVTATDIGDAFLSLAKEKEMVHDISVENVENLSFPPNSYDYVFCKEAYHHFPRPFIGVYEMLRVAKKGVVIIEPQDPVLRMPLLLALKNTLTRLYPSLLNKIWKNRFSFETVGNYVYKLSDREMEKLAMGINLPTICFIECNNNYWHKGVENQTTEAGNAEFRKIKRKLWLDNFLCKLGLKPYHVLCVILFKEKPDEEVRRKLKEKGGVVIDLPKNPYL